MGLLLPSLVKEWSIPVPCLLLKLILFNMYLNFLLIYYLLVNLLNNLSVLLSFFPSHCVFQDLHMKWMIGVGLEQDELYYLNSRSIF